ncbi:hypothetical protein G3T36_18475 [Diaminobutyricibacter tongyongensis]|uniref:Uncharacterized protein n=1 Tax=Leifsonia tongyongensis TaxID=1268043 RepID=A0A6L9Y2P5_9MICO|nr:hypothetical protein [Diaminobutyricibacter tongyongensis]NEN07846.1 hypothetical protein [Diaminobutyricibacter tongyongensis]
MDSNLNSRRPSEALVDILGISLFLGVILTVTMSALAGADLAALFALLSAAGGELYGQLGWVFGIFFTALIAFYVGVIGDQISDERGRLRFVLGAIAQTIASFMLVGLLVILFSFFSHPERWATLLFIVPAAGLVLFLATQLGAFVIPDTTVRLRLAAADRDRARATLPRLKPRSRRPWLAVWLVDSTLIGVIALIVGLPATTPPSVPLLFVSLVAGSALVNLWCGLARYLWILDVSRASRTLDVALGLSPIVIFAGLGIAFVFTSSLWAGLSILVMVTLCAGVTTMPLRWNQAVPPQWLVDWTVGGVVIRIAARSSVKRYVRAVRTVRELERAPERKIAFPAFAQSPDS